MKAVAQVTQLALLLLFGFAAQAQQVNPTSNPKPENSKTMKTYLIERDIPDAGKLTKAELKGISQTSCKVLKDMDGIEWMHSYVTDNKVYCVYKAESEKLLKEHGKKGKFPITEIMEIANVISPATAAAE